MPRKLDPLRLETLLRSGMTQKQIAQKLCVHPSNVCRAAATLRYASSQSVMLFAADKIGEQKINAMEKLQRIMSVVENELSYIQTTIKGAKVQPKSASS